jgi:hypothetical protein
MPIFIGGHHINIPGKDEPKPIVVQRQQEIDTNLEAKRVRLFGLPPESNDVEDNRLIQYKESSFISDMIQSDKE